MGEVKMKKLLSIFVGLMLVLTVFAGCSNTETTKKEDKKEETTDKFDSIKEKGEVVVGFDNTFVPMGFKDEKGETVGFDVDLAKEVFKRVGIDVKFQPIDWAMKETELNTGKIDLIWNGYTITDERKEKVAFTNPYLENRQVIITLADSKVKTKDELKGKKVATQAGSSSLDAINSEADLASAFDGGKPVLFENYTQALMDLEVGRVDAVVADEILIRYYISERGAEKYAVLEDNFGNEEYGIGVRKTDKKLLEAVQKAMDEMKADGTSAEISKKWFAEDIIK
jgi:polar amino acid transport system substrate-binding protein